MRSCTDPSRSGRSPLAALFSCLALAACSSEQLSLGAGESPLENPNEPGCNGGTWVGDVSASEQGVIDALAGCQEIVGDLRVQVPTGGSLDLTPLGELRIVRGLLILGPDEQGDGQLTSLAGLESLEQVGALTLLAPVPDLLPLAKLERVEMAASDRDGGYLEITSDTLVDLAGLEGLRQWSTLNLRGAQLTSLNGLGLPVQEVSVRIEAAPALRDVSALSGTSGMSLQLWSTGIENLAGLEVTQLGSLDLRFNERLTSIDGLDRLERLGSLSLEQNPLLDHLPEWPGLFGLNEVQVVNNAALREFPAYWDAGVTTGPLSLGGFFSNAQNPDELYIEFLAFEVANNPSLTHVTLPGRSRRGQYVGIYGNAALESLDLRNLEAVDMLSIRDNAVLDQLDVSALQTVDDLAVEDNPQLVTTGLSAVRTFSGNIAGNAP